MKNNKLLTLILILIISFSSTGLAASWFCNEAVLKYDTGKKSWDWSVENGISYPYKTVFSACMEDSDWLFGIPFEKLTGDFEKPTGEDVNYSADITGYARYYERIMVAGCLYSHATLLPPKTCGPLKWCKQNFIISKENDSDEQEVKVPPAYCIGISCKEISTASGVSLHLEDAESFVIDNSELKKYSSCLNGNRYEINSCNNTSEPIIKTDTIYCGIDSICIDVADETNGLKGACKKTCYKNSDCGVGGTCDLSSLLVLKKRKAGLLKPSQGICVESRYNQS